MNTNTGNKISLFENAEHFRSIVHNIDGYVYTVLYNKGEAAASYHSPRCLDYTGYSQEDYNADPELWLKMVAPEDRDFIFSFFNSRKVKAEQTYLEHRIIRKDGEKRWVADRFTEQADENGLLTRRDGFIFDITERKQVELALKEQNLFLQHLIDAIPNPVFYKDFKGCFKGCNNAFEEYTGKNRDEIVGKKTIDIMTPEHTELHDRMDQNVYNNRGLMVYESDFLHAGGSLRKIIYYKAPYLNAQGEIAGVVGVMMDTTQLKATEETLHQTYVKLKEMESIVNKSPAIVFLRNASGRLPIEFVSDNISQFGYSPVDFLDGTLQFIDIVFQGDRGRVHSEMQRNAKTGTSDFTQEYRIIHKNGDLIWVDDHCSLRFDYNKKLSHYIGVIIDVSKRNQALQLFRESNERYRTLAENSYDLISEIDSEGKLLYISPNFSTTLGLEHDEVENSSLFNYIHPEDLALVIKELKNSSGQVNHRLKHKSGEWLWFESAGKQYITADRSKRGVIVSRDISVRKRLQQQIIRTEKLLAVGEMSAMIAHEFRNSLTSIKMILQLQKESPNIRPNEKRPLKIALDSIQHMESVLKQLLNFAQPASIMFQKADINIMLDDCVRFIELQAHKMAIHLSIRVDTALPLILMHSPSMRECILNLMLNATQAFERDLVKIRRRIHVSTKLVTIDEQLVDTELSVDNEYFKIKGSVSSKQEIILDIGTQCALIKIADNAGGIDEAFLAHIFEPFFTSKEKGTGLGLSISKRIVNSHGGIMRAVSDKGRGTTFKIYLPLLPPV